MNQNPRLRLVVSSDPAADRPVDPADLGQVFRRFAPYVARVAARILGHDADLEDLVQDVFLDANRGLSKLRDADAVRGWLSTVTVRKARHRLRRRRLLGLIGFEPPLEAGLDRQAPAQDRAFVLAVYHLLDQLPANERIAWVMNRVEGESLERVAEVCGCSRATAHRHVTRAQAEIEKGLTHADGQ
jgi:RNA polymerase sigma-70 factor (ECF subfamily)